MIKTNKKLTVILEDVNKSNAREIRESKTSLGICLKSLGEYSGNIVVIAEQKEKIKVFESSTAASVMIQFQPTSILNKSYIDLQVFEGKVVVYDKCLDGLTSTYDIFSNLREIATVALKFVAIDTIGEGFLSTIQFKRMLKFIGVNDNVNQFNMQKYNNLLLNNFTILENESVINSITKNYWTEYSNNSINSSDNKFVATLEGFSVIKQDNLTKKESMQDNNKSDFNLGTEASAGTSFLEQNNEFDNVHNQKELENSKLKEEIEQLKIQLEQFKQTAKEDYSTEELDKVSDAMKVEMDEVKNRMNAFSTFGNLDNNKSTQKSEISTLKQKVRNMARKLDSYTITKGSERKYEIVDKDFMVLFQNKKKKSDFNYASNLKELYNRKIIIIYSLIWLLFIIAGITGENTSEQSRAAHIVVGIYAGFLILDIIDYVRIRKRIKNVKIERIAISIVAFVLYALILSMFN